ncbi:MAG: hypothetical protein WCW13_03330 [archaeon]|jgi:hypothetical protein
MKTGLTAYFDSAKRNCMLCHTYKNIKPSEDQKEMALTSTKKAYDALREAFDALRVEDAELDKLDKVRAAKVLCLDAIDACGTCDKQRPRIKEILIDIK